VTAAYLHILGDLLLSVGVVISSFVIYYFPVHQYPWSKYFDPACTLIFSVIICYTCKATLFNSVYILMEGSPAAVDVASLKGELE
jgi:Co/Zn/Cd efflux system component